MKLEAVMDELTSMGSEQIKKIYLNHGAKEPFFGVKVGDMKTIVKKIKKNHELSLELFDTGNSDAQYLAGLIADEKKISKKELQHWVKKASWYMINEYTVPWIAAESKFGYELGLEWSQSEEDSVCSSGWNTLSSLCTIKPDVELDKKEFKKLLKFIEKNIHSAQNRTRYTMNGFVMACGQCVVGLYDEAFQVAKKIGEVKVDLGKTACKVPLADQYLEKMKSSNYLGKKKKQARC